MKFATLPNGTEDGELILVSRDLSRATRASDIAPSLLAALRDWDRTEPMLRKRAEALESGNLPDAFTFDPASALAPLPRAPQWLDGSAFLNHGRLMDEAFGNDPLPEVDTIPLVYQGASDDFLGAQIDLEEVIALAAFREMRARKKNPALDPEAFAQALERNRLAATANRQRLAAELI